MSVEPIKIALAGQLIFQTVYLPTWVVATTKSKAGRVGFSAVFVSGGKFRKLCGHVHTSYGAAQRCGERQQRKEIRERGICR
jgi:hypothetical protein